MKNYKLKKGKKYIKYKANSLLSIYLYQKNFTLLELKNILESIDPLFQFHYCLICNSINLNSEIPFICKKCCENKNINKNDITQILRYVLSYLCKNINTFLLPLVNLLEGREFGTEKCIKCNSENYYSNTFFCYTCYKKNPTNECIYILFNYIIENFKKSFDIQNSINKKHKCLLCDNYTENLICEECKKSIQNKEIYLKISNEKDITILDNKYKGNYTCDDGHIVKSLGEKIIDDFLWKNKIFHIYEPKINIDIDKDITPDFLLPNYNNSGHNIYIEHFGISNNKKYLNQEDYKINLYKKEKITLICTYEEDLKNINNSLSKKLKFYKEKQINFYKENSQKQFIIHKTFGKGEILDTIEENNVNLIKVLFEDKSIGMKTLIAHHPFITYIKK